MVEMEEQQMEMEEQQVKVGDKQAPVFLASELNQVNEVMLQRVEFCSFDGQIALVAPCQQIQMQLSSRIQIKIQIHTNSKQIKIEIQLKTCQEL